MIRISPTTYLPVLRWKGAGQLAISRIKTNHRRRIVPIVEPVPRDFLPLANASGVSEFAKSLAAVSGWGPERPLLLDPHLLGEQFAGFVIPHIAVAAARYNITFGLVTGLTRDQNYHLAVRQVLDKLGCDVALRVHACSSKTPC
jgi:hypothetical protein